MKNNVIYTFQDVSILLNSTSTGLIYFIEKYSLFAKETQVSQNSFRFSFSEEENINSMQNFVPEDAILEIDAPVTIDKLRNFKRYSKGDTDAWHIYEGYGAVHVNYKNNEILSFFYSKIDPQEITPFIILFIHPIVRSILNFGYIFLHAACIKVFNRNILITGLSGRGKSTASFALLNRGHSVLTDETTLIRNVNGRFNAYAITDSIKIREHALNDFFKDLDKPYLVSGDEYILRLSELNKKYITKIENIHHIFILEQTGKDKTIIEETNTLSVIPELFPHSLSTTSKLRTDKVFNSLIGLLDTVECFKVKFGTDMENFIDEMEKTLSYEV